MVDHIISPRAIGEVIALVDVACAHRQSPQMLEARSFLVRLKRHIEKPVVTIAQGPTENVFLIDGDPWCCDPRAVATAQAFFVALKTGLADSCGRSPVSLNNARVRLLTTLPKLVEQGVRCCRITGGQIIFDRRNSKILFI